MDEYIKEISNTEIEITKNILLYVKDPNKYEYIKDKPFSYADDFFQLHGSHRTTSYK